MLNSDAVQRDSEASYDTDSVAMPNAVLIVTAQKGKGNSLPGGTLCSFGLHAQHCTSGKRAQAVLCTGTMRPLPIVDAELPDMTGYELLRTVRTLWPTTAVVLIRADVVASGELQLIRPGICLVVHPVQRCGPLQCRLERNRIAHPTTVSIPRTCRRRGIAG